jgi:glutaredoxin-dependent peroxiredoxin
MPERQKLRSFSCRENSLPSTALASAKTGLNHRTFDTFHNPFYINLPANAGQTFKQTTINKFMAIKVGSKAPDFTLKTKTAAGLADIKLSENFGKKNTVLLFVPAAFTGVCTKELCEISAGLGAYAGLNAAVIGISVDTPFSQEAWAKQEHITIPLASDLNKTVTKAYDVLFPNLAGIGDTAARAAFVIDKNGVVQYAEQTPTPGDLPNFAAVKAALARLA